MKITIPGGCGFIGQALARFYGKDHTVIILTRNNGEANNANGFVVDETVAKNIQFVEWNGKDVGEWYKVFDGADMVVNLAGKSVNCRYTVKNKQAIFDSRTYSTKAIGEAIRMVVNPPKLWINAASATIYRDAGDKPQDEYTGEIKDDFSVQVCKLWEKVFFDENTPVTRKVALRTAITLGQDGVMNAYLNLCKFYLGGKQGNGDQMYSWIHIDDLVNIIEFIRAHNELNGVYNASSPNPVTNKIFMKTIRKATGNSIGLPAAKWMLKIGAFVIGTEPELVLKSRWVLPTKISEAGYIFKYPQLSDALKSIIEKIPRKEYRLF